MTFAIPKMRNGTNGKERSVPKILTFSSLNAEKNYNTETEQNLTLLIH